MNDSSAGLLAREIIDTLQARGRQA